MAKSLKLGLQLGISLLAICPMAAPLLAANHPLAALLIRSFYSRLCHQYPERSFVLHGAPVAVCVRCLGIYLGVALGAFLPAPRVAALRWLALAFVCNAIDVVTATMHLHGNLPLLRFGLGWLLGWSVGAVLFSPGLRRSCPVDVLHSSQRAA